MQIGTAAGARRRLLLAGAALSLGAAIWVMHVTALLAALGVDVDYVAFVGRRRKAEVLKEAMAARGVAPERLAKLKAPAGLDLGAISPDEIAISILAEIVALRRGKHSRGTPPAV